MEQKSVQTTHRYKKTSHRLKVKKNMKGNNNFLLLNKITKVIFIGHLNDKLLRSVPESVRALIKPVHYNLASMETQCQHENGLHCLS